jgi:hypothetical protein
LSLEIAEALAEPTAERRELKVRKRDRWLKNELDQINARIDRMDQRKELWEMRDRMDDLQGQIDDLRLEVREEDGTRATTEMPAETRRSTYGSASSAPRRCATTCSSAASPRSA